MRTLFCAIALFISAFQLHAQTASDCRISVPVCADVPVLGQTIGVGGVDDFEDVFSSGCLLRGGLQPDVSVENSSAWYVFRAQGTGQLGFDIEALTDTAEFDFAVYGSNADCASISTGNLDPIRCNYEVNGTGFTGLGINPVDGRAGGINVPGSQNTYDEFLNVVEGQVYTIFINNFNARPGDDPAVFSLTFTGELVNSDPLTALDCSFRDDFLGQDIIACEGDPSIVLSALNSGAGSSIDTITWFFDANGDGALDQNEVVLSGPDATEITVDSPNSGRYFVSISFTNPQGETEVISDDILITFFGPPEVQEVLIIDQLADMNNIQIIPVGEGDFEYSLNGGEFQESPFFLDVPPGENSVVINDRNGCGTAAPFEFLVVGFPKFFTPNGDGIHDTWNIKGIETLANPVVFIFDRFGKLLKQLDNSSSGGWDGIFNGRRLPSSDYWFRLEFNEQEQGMAVARLVRANFTLKR